LREESEEEEEASPVKKGGGGGTNSENYNLNVLIPRLQESFWSFRKRRKKTLRDETVGNCNEDVGHTSPLICGNMGVVVGGIPRGKGGASHMARRDRSIGQEERAS